MKSQVTTTMFLPHLQSFYHCTLTPLQNQVLE